jgi:tRNA(Ile)-lysidine synthase
VRRSETVALCRHLGLDPVLDPSNQDLRFVRNRVRHQLVPLCSAIAGRDVVPVLARQASVLAGDADLLDAVTSLVDPARARALAAAPEPAARRAVRTWLSGEGPYPPPIDAVERVLEVARNQRRATEIPGGRRVGRSGGRLTVSPAVGSRRREGGAARPPEADDGPTGARLADDGPCPPPVQSGRDQRHG